MDIFSFLDQHGISYERFDHPAVFTCDEAERLCPDMPGTSIKNLFLRDRSGAHHFLVSVGYGKNVDLKKLAEALGVSKLSFASPERLQRYLGVDPGSVTLLGLVHDRDHAVQVILDTALQGQVLQCHPLVNTQTLVISAEDLQRFFSATGHAARFLDVPGR